MNLVMDRDMKNEFGKITFGKKVYNLRKSDVYDRIFEIMELQEQNLKGKIISAK